MPERVGGQELEMMHMYFLIRTKFSMLAWQSRRILQATFKEFATLDMY